MSTIKTLKECVHERMNECVDVLGKKYIKTVLPIYGSDELGNPCHISSCILIKVKNKNYIITAAHVIDNNKITTLYVGGGDGGQLVKIEGECLVIKENNDNRKDDKIDIAILSLTEDIVKKLDKVTFIDESSFLSKDSLNTKGLYLAVGYPNSRNKKNNNKENKILPKYFRYAATLNTSAETFKEIGADKRYHYLLKYDKISKDENNKEVNSIKLTGMSGGGLFFIEGMDKPENYRPNVDCTGKLAGILIEHHEKQKVIMATKLSLAIQSL